MYPHSPGSFTGALGNAGLAEGTNAGTFQTANAIDYAVKGLAFTKAATDNIDFTAAEQQAVGTKCLYLVQIDDAGTVSTKKGVEVDASDHDEGLVALNWPAPDADQCPLGAIEVETDGSTTFTADTTDLGASGITDTYHDFAGGVPDRPLAA